MLSSEQIIENRDRFNGLLKSLNKEENDVDGFIQFLHDYQFYTSPATSKYYGSYRGGLCEYSLDVYDKLKQLVEVFYPDTKEETIIKLGLLQSLSKLYYYEEYERNVKDESGKWTKVKDYKLRDSSNRFTFGNVYMNAYILASRYISFTEEEICVLTNCDCNITNECSNQDLFAILNKYPLTTLLHTAILLSCSTKKEEEND